MVSLYLVFFSDSNQSIFVLLSITFITVLNVKHVVFQTSMYAIIEFAQRCSNLEMRNNIPNKIHISYTIYTYILYIMYTAGFCFITLRPLSQRKDSQVPYPSSHQHTYVHSAFLQELLIPPFVSAISATQRWHHHALQTAFTSHFMSLAINRWGRNTPRPLCTKRRSTISWNVFESYRFWKLFYKNNFQKIAANNISK